MPRLHEDENDEQDRPRKQVLAQRPGCSCANHNAHLAKKFVFELYENLVCYCHVDRSSSRCQCSSPSWGDMLLSHYTGRDYVSSSADFLYSEDSKLYERQKSTRY